MTVKFVCQKFGHGTEVDMHYNKDIDAQVFTCNECGAGMCRLMKRRRPARR